jgi:NAD(P)-dependent dehydrogenase (short-subunit alcohol dehydrogenase family)
MKIVVIGRTRHIRLETVERLRKAGHDVVTSSPKLRLSTITAPLDLGHAGRPLRDFLEKFRARPIPTSHRRA